MALSAAMLGQWLLAIGVLLGGILVMVLIYMLAERIARRPRRRHVGENVAFKLPRRGIIFTVGRQVETITFALDRQQPELVGLICTDATEDFADAVIERMGNTDRTRKRLVDPQNIREIRNTTDALIDWLLERGLSPREIVVDVTGGMTTMSVGVFSAADERRIDSQYIKSDFDERNRPIPGTQEGVFVVRYSDLPKV